MSPALFSDEVMRPTFDREALSQWFTPPDLAQRMAEWCGVDVLRGARRILEPSAGRGAIIAAICRAHVHAALGKRPVPDVAMRITAHEIDPRHVAYLRRTHTLANVLEGDYLAAPAPAERYDLAVMNPPYEGGLDEAFLSKAMDESERVVALVRLVALAGQERYRRVWSRVGPGREFGLEGLEILSARPDFGGGGGNAKSDFCVVKLTRGLEGAAQTHVEWW